MVGICIYNVIDVCMIKGNENVLVFIKLLLDLFYSYKYYIKIILSFVELILKVSYYFLIFWVYDLEVRILIICGWYCFVFVVKYIYC